LIEINKILEWQTDDTMEAAAHLSSASGGISVPAVRQAEDASKRMMVSACTVKAIKVPLGQDASVLSVRSPRSTLSSGWSEAIAICQHSG
jgi:hypothetical protein